MVSGTQHTDMSGLEDISTTRSSKPRLDNLRAPGSWTTAGHSCEYDSHPPDDSAISASSFNMRTSSSYRPAMNGLTNTELFRVESEMITLLHDMSNEDLCLFAELHEDPVNDVQIELYIFTYFLLFTGTLLTEYLE